MNRAELIVEGKREHAWMRGSKGAHLGMARAGEIPAAYFKRLGRTQLSQR